MRFIRTRKKYDTAERWAKLQSFRPLFVLVFLVAFFGLTPTVYGDATQGQNGVKSSVKITWVNRAKVLVSSINISNDDHSAIGFDLSDEANATYFGTPGPSELNRMLNLENGGSDSAPKEYTDDQIFDRENFYNHPNCKGGNSAVVFGNDGEGYSIDGTNQGALVVASLVFKQEFTIQGGGTRGDCHALVSGTTQAAQREGSRLITEMIGTNNKNIWFEYVGGNHDRIKRVDGRQTYSREKAPEGSNVGEKPNDYLIDGDGGGVAPNDECDGSVTRVIMNEAERKDPAVKQIHATWYTCDEAGVKNILVSRSGNEGTDDTITNNPDDSIEPGGGADADCEVQMLNPLTWLFCPIVEAAVTATQTLDNIITQQMTVPVGEEAGSKFNENDTAANAAGPLLFNTWGSFRYISLGLLVIIGLIMIISQALSFGIFDAYTIKKVLPKMLIGVIGISVSWYVCQFAISIFNDLGISVRSLLYGPFKDLPGVRFDQILGSAGGAGLFAAFFAFGIVGSLTFILTALMAVLIAVAILVFREILIILLVVTSPLAIVCWILPNTEKVWKMWWDFFSKALIVFPIISLFIAGGRVVAQIATVNASGSGESNALGSIIAFIAYFGPYFALPKAFAMAGGALATISGVTNNRTKGAFDRLKNFRGERRKQRVEEFRNAGFYNTDTRRGRIGNTIGGYMFDSDERIPYKLGQKDGLGKTLFGKRSMQLAGKIEHARQEQTTEMYKHLNNNAMFNDKAYAALGGSLSDLSEATRQKFKDNNLVGEDGKGLVLDTEEKFNTAIDIMKQSDDSTERKGAAALERGKTMILNRHRDGNGYASIAGSAMLGLSTHGFGSEESMVEMANKIRNGEDDGHPDFAEGMLVFSEVNGSSGRKAGYSHSKDKEGNFITGKQAGRDWARAASKSSSDIARLKRKEAMRDVKGLLEMVQYEQATPDQKIELERKWTAPVKEGGEGLSDFAVKARKDAAGGKSAAAAKTLLSLQESYLGGATDIGAGVGELLAKNQDLIKAVAAGGNETSTAEAAAAAQARAAGGGGMFGGSGPIGGPPATGGTPI